MSMKEWAEKEIEIAKKRERGNAPEGEWDYGCACYDSALKAFNSLLEDGHSGMSIGFTKNILNRLIEGMPLSPIEDTDDIWNVSHIDKHDGYTSYQCKRMSSLFKYVYADGTVKYRENNYCQCVHIHNPEIAYHFGLVSNLIYEMFPITMPYFPDSAPMKVYCEDFLVDPANGDFDTVGIYYVMHPDGTKIGINRYFKAKDKGWEEIDDDEYKLRYSIRAIKSPKDVIPHSPTPDELEDLFEEDN